MATFGQKLRIHRRQCRDPQRGGLLTQERLGELIGVELGHRGYTGAAVSDWERDQSKIDEDDRLVLATLLSVLHKCGGFHTLEEANEMLQHGNYRPLDTNETLLVFPEREHESQSHIPKSKFAIGRQIDQVVPGERDQKANKQLQQKRRKQLLLLEKVHSFWVEGVLQTSVNDAVLLNLAWENRDDLIAHPWSGVRSSATYKKPLEVESASILDRYLASSRSLLILGEPGSGKTTTLISLASQLIIRARNDPVAPVPVILSLGSWTAMRRSISDWIVEELTAKYQIPRLVGREWLAADELVVMLDAFDEVPEKYRIDCAQAINGFRETRGLTGIVVCSRSEEYDQIQIPLLLGGAIEIKPLQGDQIDAYLVAAGSRLVVLRQAVLNDSILGLMARSPLMLSVMGSAYSYSRDDLSGVFDEISEGVAPGGTYLQRHLFETYVKRMFRGRGALELYTPEQTELWLGWLARQLLRFNTSQFLIEQLQPDWLPNRSWRWFYMMIIGVLSGFTGGIVMWIFLQVLRHSDPNLPAPLSELLVNLLQITQGRAEAITVILANILLGLVVALLQGNYFERLRFQDKESDSRGWRYNKHLVIVALVVGLLTSATISLISLPHLALIWGITEAVVFVTIARYVYGHSYRNEIRTVDALNWSWPNAINGLIAGLLLATISYALGQFIYHTPATFRSEIILSAAGLILGGLRGRRVEAKNRPNQGIYLSIRNGIMAGIISTLLVGGLAWLLRGPGYAVLTGCITFIIAAGLLGGSNVIKHFLVRSLLWWRGELPWRLADFLDYAASLIFLRKVGGSYIFLHSLLQYYFASLYALPTRPERLKTIDTAGLKRNLERGQ